MYQGGTKIGKIDTRRGRAREDAKIIMYALCVCVIFNYLNKYDVHNDTRT